MALLIPLLLVSIYGFSSDFVGNVLLFTPLSMFNVIMGVFAIVQQGVALKRKEVGAGLGSIGLATMFVAHTSDFMVVLQMFDIPYTGQYSVGVYILCQSMILGKRFAETYKKTKTLSEELKVTNSELVEQQSQIQQLNAELSEYNEKLEEKVNEKTRDIRSILTSISQGIVTINGPEGQLGQKNRITSASYFLKCLMMAILTSWKAALKSLVSMMIS